MAKNYENENKTSNYSTDKATSKMRLTARTAAKMLPEILQKMRPAIRHLTHMTKNRMTIPTDTKAKTSGKFSPFFLCKK